MAKDAANANDGVLLAVEEARIEQTERGEGAGVPAPAASSNPAADRPEGGDADHEEDIDDMDEAEDDEKETCGFCIFMKGGGCKEAFEAWSHCVDSERGKDDSDFTETCREATLALRECMLAHKDYYQPLLDEEERDVEARADAEADAESK